MHDDSNDPDFEGLRGQAEAMLLDQEQPPSVAAGDPNSHKLLHELQVHQVELRMQNEELRRVQLELEASRAHYLELYEFAPMGYCTLSEEGTIRQTNLALGNLLGIARKDLLGQPLQRFILGGNGEDREDREDREVFRRHLRQMLASVEPRSCELRMVKKDGTVFRARLQSVGAPEVDGRRYCRTAFTDITESKRTEEALRQQKEFFHQIAESLSDFIAVLDLEGKRIYNSPSYERFFGRTRDLQNTDSFADVHPDDRERIRQVFRETVQTGRGSQIEYRFVMADGSIRDMESRGSLITDPDGRAARVLVVARDITERNRLQAQIRHMAFHDVLTGLPNRRLFSDRLSQAMAAATRIGSYGALIFLDLDDFKPLNDTRGHDIGDLLLIEAASRLKRCVREMDTVARFGGDEFVVMLEQLSADKSESVSQAGTVAEKLRVALSAPYHLTPADRAVPETVVEHRCTASIGVALFRGHEASAGSILKGADSAMYLAKQAGGNQVSFVTPGAE